MISREFANLTGIRGLAALWVVLFHFQTTPVVSSLHLGAVVANGGWGVDIFFVLSGLILAINYAPIFSVGGLDWALFGNFLIKRFARIYPLHFATFIVVLAAWSIAVRANYSFRTAVTNDWWTALCNVLMIHAWGVTTTVSWNIPSWSISAEWFAYLFVFPITVIVSRRFSAAVCVGVALAAWLLFIAYTFVRYSGNISRVTVDGVVRIIPEFLAGYAIYRLGIGNLMVNFGSATALGASAAICCIALLPPPAVVLLLPAIMLLMMGLYRGGLIVDKVFGSRVTVFLGRISYSIYMMHVLVQIIVNQIIRHLEIAPTLYHASLLLAGEVVFTIGCSYLAYVIIELPSRQWVIRHSGLPGVAQTI